MKLISMVPAVEATMTTTTTSSETKPSRASEHLKRANFRRRVERAHKMAALKELGLVRPSAEIIPMPRREPKAKAEPVPQGGAKILLFTGVRRERWN
jgi:hypothetical protein